MIDEQIAHGASRKAGIPSCQPLQVAQVLQRHLHLQEALAVTPKAKYDSPRMSSSHC